MTTDSEFARLLVELQSDPSVEHDKHIAVLLAHARHTSGALLGIRESMGGVMASVQTLTTEMKANTEITQAVRDAMTAGRVATLIIKWIGGIALAFASIYGLWTAIRHGGGVDVGEIGPG